ncbi:hypothetical protein HpBTM60_10810 [Helicobacter pylori]
MDVAWTRLYKIIIKKYAKKAYVSKIGTYALFYKFRYNLNINYFKYQFDDSLRNDN